MVKTMNDIKVVTCSFFKPKSNYSVLQESLSQLDCSSREIPDLMTETMSELYPKAGLSNVHISHWHHIMDDDARTLRNILKIDKATGEPKHHCREHDLLQYLSLCMQFLNSEYAQYVQNWCKRQVLCLDDPDENI